MNKKEQRYLKIISFLKDDKKTISEILSFLNNAVGRKTLQRDLNILISEKKVTQSGAGRSVAYYISEFNKTLLPIDVEKYFDIDYQKREVKENFNFEVFDILENEIFNNEEKKKIEDLQKEFRNNISKYKSQTLINKEFERIMIEFS
jgi:hypothetical protein